MVGRPRRDDGKNSQTVGKNKYNAANYDRIAVSVLKGNRDRIKQAAQARGVSVNGYINNLLAADIPDFEILDSNDNYIAWRAQGDKGAGA